MNFIGVITLIYYYHTVAFVCFSEHGFRVGKFLLNLVNILISFLGVLGEGVLLWCLYNLQRLWTTWCLMCSCSGGGSGVNAASASRARLLSQCLSLWCRLYLRPLFKSAISSLVKEMLVLFTNLR